MNHSLVAIIYARNEIHFSSLPLTYVVYLCAAEEAKAMNELLKALYDNFYQPSPAVKLKSEIEACHQTLIERLEKPERRLVLQIIDCKDQIAEDRPIDSFISGFRLAWR